MSRKGARVFDLAQGRLWVPSSPVPTVTPFKGLDRAIALWLPETDPTLQSSARREGMFQIIRVKRIHEC
jgi:hypothetical protein